LKIDEEAMYTTFFGEATRCQSLLIVYGSMDGRQNIGRG